LRKVLACLAFILALAAAGCSSRDEQIEEQIPEILGEVNNEYLTTDEFLHHFKVRGGMELSGEARKEFKRWLFAELVERKLLLQEARKRRIRPSRAGVRRAFAKMGDRGWDEAERELAGSVEDEMYEQRQIEILLLNALPLLKQPKKAEIRRYLKKHPEDFQRPVQVRLRQIVVHSASKVRTVQAELSSGASFMETMRRHSTLSNVPSKDQLTWVGESDLSMEVWEAVREAPVKKPVGPVVSAHGTHFLLVVERRKAGPVPATEASAIARKRLRQEWKRRAMASYLAKLRKSAKIKVDLKALDLL